MKNQDKAKEQLTSEKEELCHESLEWGGSKRERLSVKEALRRSEERYCNVYNTAPLAFVIWDRDCCITGWNKCAEKFFGWSREEVIGRNFFEFLIPQRTRPHVEEIVASLLRGELPSTSINENLTKGGEIVLCEWNNSILYDSEGRVEGAISLALDITDRRRSEEALWKVNRALKMLSECNHALVRAANEESLLHSICEIIVEEGGYRLAWVGIAMQDEKKTVIPVAQAGYEDGYLESLNITWDDTKRGRGPTGTAIRIKKPSIAKDILHDPKFAPWRAEAIKRGYASSIAILLIDNDRALGALNIYAAEADAFNEDEVTLLAQLADDLSFGIMALRTRVERKRAVAALQEAHDELERRVEERTAELVEANAKLKSEIEDRKRLEKALAQKEKLETLGAIAAEVAHEIRNPLVSIGGFARRLQNKFSDLPECDIILKESQRLERILARIKNYLEPVEISFQECSVNEIITDCLELLSPEAERRRVRCRLDLDPKLSAVYSDPSILAQIFINLILNATEAMQKGGNLNIRTFEIDKDIQIQFKNKTDRQKVKQPELLFMPFAEGGKSIGLPLSYRLLKDMGGLLSLAQEQDWMIFTVSLPKTVQLDAGRKDFKTD
ncbi:MAG: PAS domain S-box protein [Deltaproteobacteria bacterium]|nr:MAG: PAS domain S-box protein [Deltaproteobacteria bacterium]